MLDLDERYLSDNEASLIPNLARRVRNLALGPTTPSNALVPIFETVHNSLHAISDRFGDEWCEKGEIIVSFMNKKKGPLSVEIRDNGVGMDERNFASFRTYDSDWKYQRGGKGVGRFSWLKVFYSAEITSRFFDEGVLKERSFMFVIDNRAPIQHMEVTEFDTSRKGDLGPGTTILLREMRHEYAENLPVLMDTILRKLVAHFLPYLIAPNFPEIIFQSDETTINLGEFLREKKLDIGGLDVDSLSSKYPKLKLTHNLLERGLVEGKATHKLYFAAHDRVVGEFDIGTMLGLTTYIEKDGAKHVYAGVLSGDLFDSAVNSERTSFDLDEVSINKIKGNTVKLIAKTLSSQIDRVIQQQTELTKAVVKKYPRYAYLIDDPRVFAEKKMPRHFRSAEQIYQQLAVYDFRENRDIERKVEALSKSGANASESAIDEGIKAILSKLSKQEYSVLADYTVKRKVVLDLVEKRIGYKPNGEMKHEAEEALHSFVVPMRVENRQISVEDHNLWLIDDKLTYYEYWASDKKLRTFIDKSQSDDRPDVVLFNGRSAYHRPGTDQPVVIIEFKKPVRKDYDDEENPFTQIYSYIEEMRDGKILDKDGGQIQEVDDHTPFFCYIIADITPNLKKWLRMAQINVPLPGGGGYYGFNPDYNAFVQALSYKYVLKDARLRNEAFFKRLKI